MFVKEKQDCIQETVNLWFLLLQIICNMWNSIYINISCFQYQMQTIQFEEEKHENSQAIETHFTIYK